MQNNERIVNQPASHQYRNDWIQVVLIIEEDVAGLFFSERKCRAFLPKTFISYVRINICTRYI